MPWFSLLRVTFDIMHNVRITAHEAVRLKGETNFRVSFLNIIMLFIIVKFIHERQTVRQKAENQKSKDSFIKIGFDMFSVTMVTHSTCKQKYNNEVSFPYFHQ